MAANTTYHLIYDGEDLVVESDIESPRCSDWSVVNVSDDCSDKYCAKGDQKSDKDVGAKGYEDVKNITQDTADEIKKKPNAEDIKNKSFAEAMKYDTGSEGRYQKIGDGKWANEGHGRREGELEEARQAGAQHRPEWFHEEGRDRLHLGRRQHRDQQCAT